NLETPHEERVEVRVEDWNYLMSSVMPYRPLGAGLGAGSLGEVRFSSDSDLPPIDRFILVVAVACGIPGVLLFIWILGRSAWLSIRNARSPDDEGGTVRRIVAAVMLALILNSIFGLTFTLY